MPVEKDPYLNVVENPTVRSKMVYPVAGETAHVKFSVFPVGVMAILLMANDSARAVPANASNAVQIAIAKNFFMIFFDSFQIDKNFIFLRLYKEGFLVRQGYFLAKEMILKVAAILSVKITFLTGHIGNVLLTIKE